MKKITAYLLTLVLLVALFPVGTTSAAKLGDKPYYIVNIGGGFKDIPYAYDMPMFYTFAMNAETKEPRISVGGKEGIPEIAQYLKENFNARPDGTRYFQLCLVHDAFHAKAEDVVYHDAGKEMTKIWLEKFLAEYSRIGGKLDGIIVDLEYIESHAYYLKDYYDGKRNKTQNKNIYHDIVSDSRYVTQIRNTLVEAGFEFYEDPDGDKSELWCLYTTSGMEGHKNCYNIWNALMDNMECDAITESVYEPLIKYYPNATVSDYHAADFKGWIKALDNFGAIRSWNTNKAGNVSNYNSYSKRPELSFYGSDANPAYKNPPSYTPAVYEASSFHTMQYDINLMKDMYNSTDNGRINVWVADHVYNVDMPDWDIALDGSKATYSYTPYYSEVMYHLGMLNPEPFLGFVVAASTLKRGYEVQTCMEVLSDLMVELTRVAGSSDRKPIMTQSSWNGSYILSGMYSAGRNIWRLTPDTSVVSLKDFKVAGDDPTFSVNGLTIKFPGGKILEDSKIREVGTCGYWIETAADVYPIITGTADRYAQNPSYLENFEGYKAGAAFTSASALPKACWEVDGSATIQANGNNKVLKMTGNAIIKNVKLPKNITAGDEYAKQQAWEVTFTLPEGDYGALTLLSTGEKDGALKVEKGKVYYDEKGSYKELEGVTLAAGTYTLKREVNFRDAAAYTSSYTVYDAAGNVAGQVKDVPMIADLLLPVQGISVKVIGAANAVFVDDYKLYPTGMNTVFELYETKFGQELADVTVKRTDETAYRLSWLNATDSVKSYSVVAAYYNGDALVSEKVIEKLTITPGTDGVTTGVVEKGSDGQTLLVYLRDDDTIADVPTGDGGTADGSGNNNGNNNGNTNAPSGNGDSANTPNAPTDGAEGEKKGGAVMIIVIAVIVVAAGACGAFLWLKKKKTGNKDA